jgi:hypothetical protein
MTGPPAYPRLTQSCRAIVDWATAQPGFNGTRDLLVALMRFDTGSDWERVWLHIGSPERVAAVPVTEPANALDRAYLIADAVRAHYGADAVTPAMLALGLVGAYGSGAAQAVHSGTRVTPDRFAELVGADVIGLRLSASLTGIAAYVNAPAPPVPAPTRRPAVDPAVMATRQNRANNRVGRWLLAVGVPLVLGGLFPFVQNTGSEDNGLLAMLAGACLLVVGLCLVRPRWRKVWKNERLPRGVRSGLWVAWAGWAVVVTGLVLTCVTLRLPAAATVGGGLALLMFGYGRAVLAMPAPDVRRGTAVDTALLAVVAACLPALLLGWLGWAMRGNGDYAARYGTPVVVVDRGRCDHTYPVVQDTVFWCRYAGWRRPGEDKIHRGTYYHAYHDSYVDRDGQPRNYLTDKVSTVPAYAVGDRAYGPVHVGDIDPIVVLARVAGWLGLAVPLALLCGIILFWRRSPRPARSR